MAGTATAIILADVLKLVERYENVDGVWTLTLKPGKYEEIRRAVSEVCDHAWVTPRGGIDWGCSPLVVGGILFKPSEKLPYEVSAPCETCGVGYILPSGVCDHCNT